MGTESENTENTGLSMDNRGYNDYNALMIRLDTTEIKKSIETYLRGWQEEITIDQEGNPRITYRELATPKANPTGIHSIMAWLSSTLNTQVVQGNLEGFDGLRDYIYNYRMDLAEFLMNNRINWEIKIEDFEGLIDMIMIQVKPFMSRLVNNKERESYSNTIRHEERSANTLRDRPRLGGFGRIPGLGGG